MTVDFGFRGHQNNKGEPRLSLSRRNLLRGAAGGLLLSPIAAACFADGPNGKAEPNGGDGDTGTKSESDDAGKLLRSKVPLPSHFTVPLPIPPVLRPSRTDAEADYYEISQRIGEARILPDLPTPIWGYNGIFPGPTIESRRGRRTVVRHRNELPEPVVVHLHGGRTPPEHDGYPTDTISPGSDREYTYPVDQPAATLWYHDHRMDYTGPQVYRGLAGFHLVRDDEEDALPLPRGDHEIPLMLTDRSFAEDGAFAYPSLPDGPGVTNAFMKGVLGDCVLVNGAPWPVLEVTNTRYRFRILNASNARRYRLTLDPVPPQGPVFVQVGSDQGLLEAPVEHDQLQIASAERFDIVVDFSAYPLGQQITLVNQLADGITTDVMRFVVARKATEDSHIPAKLVDFQPLTRSQAVTEREFTFRRGDVSHHGVSMWTINNELFDPSRIDADPQLGTVELWKLRAKSTPHPIHIHLAPFQVVNPGQYATGWKDTVDLDKNGEAEVLVHFDGYRGKYVFHCHNLEHEDMQMMANFQVR